jgi:hypothetical protein
MQIGAGGFGPVVAALVFYAVGLVLLYWVIRLAVRGGIEDADRRRAARGLRP